MKILIVDDHVDIRRLMKSILSSSIQDSVEILECESGEDAFLVYQEQMPDWVLMDIELQGIDGFETTSRISEAFPDAKIVFVSSHDTQKFRKHAEKLNAIGFVSKNRLLEISPLITSFKSNNPQL